VWTEGYLKSDGDFFRRSEGQWQSLKDAVQNDVVESLCSEGENICRSVNVFYTKKNL